MGRKPTRNVNLPAGMRARHRHAGTYYYLDTGAMPRREIPLGSDYVLAVQKWAELTTSKTPPAGIITFRYVAERYMRDVLPSKAPTTRSDNLRELAQLYKFFDDPPAPLESIEPVNVRQYLDWRAIEARQRAEAKNMKRAAAGGEPLPIPATLGHVRANREKALFSHIWNFARGKGLTGKQNPCAGIKGNKEFGRDIYIDDEIFAVVYGAAEQPLREALDLAYLTGQRPADVLKLSRADLKEGALHIKQNKTGKKLRIAIEGQMATVIQRLSSRKVIGLMLINNADGLPMTKSMLRGAFDRARILAAKNHPDLAEQIKAFQFRDLRAKAGTDVDEVSGINAAQDQLGHTTPMMTAHYVRHRRGKLVKPTK